MARTVEKSVSRPDARKPLQRFAKNLETAEDQITLQQLAVGSRLVVRSKLDWRFAAVSRSIEDKIVLTVCSPSGRTYRLRRDLDTSVTFEGAIPVLDTDFPEHWRENFSPYDVRW